jgi:hypothetical protein
MKHKNFKLKASFMFICVLGNCRCVLMNYMTGKTKLKAAVCVYQPAATNYRYW